MTASHAGHLERFLFVDALDFRVRERTAHNIEPEHAGQFDVLDVIAATAQKARILFPFNRMAHPLCFTHFTHPLPHRRLARPPAVRRVYLRRRVLNRLNNIQIAGTAAQVPGNRPADFVFARVRILLQERHRCHHHPRRAKAALQTVFFVKPLLNRTQDSPSARLSTVKIFLPFACTANMVHDLIGLAVQQHRARAARSRIAADMRAGEVGDVANEMHRARAAALLRRYGPRR